VGLQGTTIGASRRYDGPFGKSDRAVFFGALGLFTAWVVFENKQALHGIVMNWAMLIASLLALITIINRVRQGIQEARS
jgi:CDP-diacylglycerol--glycerol-3-phosphate 3-phosphatidyltransferase